MVVYWINLANLGMFITLVTHWVVYLLLSTLLILKRTLLDHQKISWCVFRKMSLTSFYTKIVLFKAPIHPVYNMLPEMVKNALEFFGKLPVLLNVEVSNKWLNVLILNTKVNCDGGLFAFLYCVNKLNCRIIGFILISCDLIIVLSANRKF